MTERTDAQPGLVRLSDSELILKENIQNVYVYDAFDESGEQIGSVEDLYADERAREVRFLDVAAGGFSG